MADAANYVPAQQHVNGVDPDDGSEHFTSADEEDDAEDIMVEFEDIDTADGPEVLKTLASCQVKWDKDVEYFFSDLEMRMELLTITSQWYKRIVLVNNLPEHVKAQLRTLLKKNKAAAGSTIYKDIKTKVRELFAKKEESLFDEAFDLVMTSTPSAFAKELVERLCECDPPLENCCQARTVAALWRKQLPGPVRQAIAGLKLKDKDSFELAMKKADDAWLSMGNKASAKHTAALTARAAPAKKLNNPPAAQPAGNGGNVDDIDGDDDEEIAAASAFNRGRGRGRFRGRGRSRGQSRGRGGKPHPSQRAGGTTRGERHADGPPESACNQHWNWGRQAFFCGRKSTCPWRDECSPPQEQ